MSNDISLLRQAFVSQRQFYDDQNFPRGFSRSGNFTLLEASILEQHGVVLKGVKPSFIHFLAVQKCQGRYQ